MTKVLLSVGLMLGSLAGFSGAVLAERPQPGLPPLVTSTDERSVLYDVYDTYEEADGVGRFFLEYYPSVKGYTVEDKGYHHYLLWIEGQD